MKIQLKNYEQCYPKRLKRLFRSNINLRTYNSFIPKMERAVVGNIPIEIIKMFPKKFRGEKIKAFQNALAETTLKLRSEYKTTKNLEEFTLFDENYRPSKYLKDIAKAGENFLNIKLAEYFGTDFFNAKISFAGNGTYGMVYKLSLLNNQGERVMHDKALKVFHNISCEPTHLHNNYAEANFWTFLKYIAGHKLDKTQFTRHYISDLHSGYTLTEFIDPQITRTTSKLAILKLFNIKNPQDTICNMTIMGKLYDVGGFEKNKNFTADKIILKHLKKLFYANKKKELQNRLNALKLLIQNPKTPHRDKLQKVLELYENI